MEPAPVKPIVTLKHLEAIDVRVGMIMAVDEVLSAGIR
jgi:hypothetical protein